MTVLEGLIMSLESDGSIQTFVHVPPSSGPWTISTHHSTRMGKPSSSSPPVMGTNADLVAKPSNPQVPQSCLPVSGQHGPTITLV